MAAHPRNGSPLWAGEIARFEPGTAGLQSGVAPNACRIKISQVGWHWVHPPSLSLATGQTLSKTGFLATFTKTTVHFIFISRTMLQCYFMEQTISKVNPAHTLFSEVSNP
jgi:hypothetical protein